MYKNQEGNNRRKDFKRNNFLENLLTELNDNLWYSERELLTEKEPEYPIIFIMGPHRSGTTLLMQWFANLGVIAYPTNLLSRFYKAPIIGSKIQLLLTNKKYRYRNEFTDLNNIIKYDSENGKTNGVLAPNEFWYFWRRFLPFHELDYLPTEELFKKVDVDVLKAELVGITNIFQMPFILKGMILNFNIDFLNKIFEKAIFIYSYREPLANIESAVKAREKQFGNMNEWYSFKIPEYEELKKLNPFEQVAGQIYHINKAVTEGIERVPEHKKLVVQYEDFCRNPRKLYNKMKKKLITYGYELNNEYNGIQKFEIKRKSVNDINIIKAYNKFYN